MRAPPSLGWSKHKVKNIHNLQLSPTIRDFAFTFPQTTKGIPHHSLVKQYPSNPKSPCTGTEFRSLSGISHNSQHLNQFLNQNRIIFNRSKFFTAEELFYGERKMHAWIQFITTPTADTPGTALLLHFDKKRYIIGNIHEGLTRACIQMGVKLTRVSEVLITGKTEWKNTGGLMGLVMTLADTTTAAASQGKDSNSTPSVTIHGGDNITHTLATGRHFIFRKGMPVRVKEYLETDGRNKSEHGWAPDWADPEIQVWAMVIEPSSVEMPTIPAEPKSPGKRSFDDFAREDSPPTESVKFADSMESSPRSRRDVCATVVIEMFASSWQKDNLEEKPLAEVAMPARLFVRNKDTKRIEPYTGPLPGEGPVSDVRVLVRKPWPGANKARLPSTKPSHSAISYIIRSQRQRGKFLVDKARALNVPFGRLRGKLAGGSDVQLEDGTIIKPEMVLGESKEGEGVAVIDLPSQDYVHSLLSRPEWKAPEVMTGVGAVIWILGSGVSQNEELQNFINDHNHLKHILSSPDHCPNHLAFTSSAVMSRRLNQVDSLHYPIPFYDNVTLTHNGQPRIGENGASEITHAERGLKVQLLPSLSIKKEQTVPPTDISEEPELSENVYKLAENARREILSQPMQNEMDNQGLPSPDAEIICLGTGSASPSKYRNVSATLLRVPGAGSYLLDCGENTMGQLRRRYSPTELSEVLRDLKLIWISHLHADHHLGITSVIKAWYEEVYGKLNPAQDSSRVSLLPEIQTMVKALVNEKRLCIASDSQMLAWLKEYSSVENFGFDRLVPLLSFPVSRTNAHPKFEWNTQVVNFEDAHSLLANTLKSTTGLAHIATCYVSHCFHAQAVTLTFPTGFKFSYSGDCRPSSRFVEIGRGSTVLLHEATFEDERRGDALAKKHSTTSEAIAVGKKMGARRILLTHFSQRYSKIPVGMDSMNVELRFDEDFVDLAGETNPAQIPIGDIDIDIPKDDIPWSQRANAESIPSTSESTSSSIIPPTVQRAPTGSVSEEVPVGDLRVGVAFDYMSVKVKDIMLMEKYTPALLKLFEEVESEEPEETEVEALDANHKIAKRKTGSQNAMVESGYTRKSAVGESTNGAESNAIDNGVGIVQVKSAKQETQEKLESISESLNQRQNLKQQLHGAGAG